MDGATTTTLRRAVAGTMLALLAPVSTSAATEDAAMSEQVTPAAGGHLAFVVEEAPSSSALQAGAEQAAADRGLSIDVHTVPASSARQASAIGRLGQDAPDGVAIAVTEPAALRDAIRMVADAGIPVVIARNGIDAWESLGASAFVGQDESLAGAAAGRRLAEMGVTNAVCVQDVALDVILEARCQAATAAMAAAGARMSTLFALDPPGDPTGVRDAIMARLVQDPSIDGVLATEEDGLAAALEARRRIARANLVVAALDPEAALLRDIEAGGVHFAVDQQPFVQGYVAVLLLALATEPGATTSDGRLVIVAPRIILAPPTSATTRDP